MIIIVFSTGVQQLRFHINYNIGPLRGMCSYFLSVCLHQVIWSRPHGLRVSRCWHGTDIGTGKAKMKCLRYRLCCARMYGQKKTD